MTGTITTLAFGLAVIELAGQQFSDLSLASLD